jgi:hypothetical protein
MTATDERTVLEQQLLDRTKRLTIGIADALDQLRPQTQVMNPSLMAVREAAEILSRLLPPCNESK